MSMASKKGEQNLCAATKISRQKSEQNKVNFTDENHFEYFCDLFEPFYAYLYAKNKILSD